MARERKTKTITFRLKPSTVIQLDQIARHNDCTRTDWLEEQAEKTARRIKAKRGRK